MDFEPAERASTRRSLIGAVGVAGFVGATAAVLGGRSVSAAAPDRPTDGDRTGLSAALSLELAAVALYAAAAGELPDEYAGIAGIMASQHSAYADSIAGAIGVSSSDTAAAATGPLGESFATSDPQAFGAAARTLENTAVATHTELLASYESTQAIDLTASIITVESRHAVVLTSLAGFASNLDEMLGNTADALDLSGGAA